MPSLSAFLARAQGGAQASFVATYKLSGLSASASGSFTLAQKPPDAKISFQSGTQAAQLIESGGKSYVCSQTTASWRCFSAGLAGLAIGALYTAFQPKAIYPAVEKLVKASGATVTTSSRTINGIAMSCVTVTGLAASKNGIFCVTSDGALGYAKASGNNKELIELTAYSTTVPSNEFVLPAKPTASPIG